MNIKEIRTMSGLTQKAFAEKYGIPKRTLESWEMGERKPPEYVAALLEKVVRTDMNIS